VSRILPTRLITLGPRWSQAILMPMALTTWPLASRGEEVSGFASAGAVNVLYGVLDLDGDGVIEGGLSSVGDQFWHQDSFGILDIIEGSDCEVLIYNVKTQ
jgi:hypothetical protein